MYSIFSATGSMVPKIQHIRTAGFSLAELIITITIISLVTAVILFRYDSFNSTTLLNSQAYEVALDIRQAQVYGLSVRSSGVASFREEYGVYFSNSSPNQYIFFQDNGSTVPAAYTAGEALNTITLDTRFAISGICSVSPCSSGGTPLNELSITFRRPNFDALFYSPQDSSISMVYIDVSPVGSTAVRTVSVSNTGQIVSN